MPHDLTARAVPGVRPETFAPDALSSNENPYPPLTSVLRVVQDQLARMNRYPGRFPQRLIEALATHHDVPAEEITTGCGSVAVAQQLVQATVVPGDEMVYAWRSFDTYPRLARISGTVPVQVPLLDDRHDLTAMASALTERLKSLDLLVVCDLVPSETALLAHVVLPVTQWAEEEGTLTTLEGRIIRRHRATTPPPEVRDELTILADLADRLTGPDGHRIPRTPRAAFDQLARASAGGPADYSGITRRPRLGRSRRPDDAADAGEPPSDGGQRRSGPVAGPLHRVPLQRRHQGGAGPGLTRRPAAPGGRLQDHAFHAEIFHTPDDRLVLCEIVPQVTVPLAATSTSSSRSRAVG
jgi:hypothetical protein